MINSDLFRKSIIAARWSLFIYFPGLLLLTLVTIAGVGYGLAHANDQAFIHVFGLAGLGLLAMGVPPLVLLSDAQTRVIKAIQFVAIIEMMVVFSMIAVALFYSMLQPQLWKAEFSYKTRGIAITKVIETPYTRPDVASGDTALGIVVTAEVSLPDALAFDRNGEAVLQGLEQSIFPEAADSLDKNYSAPFTDSYVTEVSFQDRPVRELPGLDRYGGHSDEAKSQIKLPTGIYKVTRIFLLPGLERIPAIDPQQHPEGVICKVDPATNDASYVQQQEAHLLQLTDSPLQLQYIATMSLNYRLGNHSIRRYADLQYRYQHAAWQATRQNLNLPSCTAVQAQQQQQKAEAELRQLKESAKNAYLQGYETGAGNPLYDEACAGDVAAIQQRIAAEQPKDAAWMPQMPLFSVIRECTIKTPRLAIFKLLAPAAYLQAKHKLNHSEQEENQAQLCRLIEELHKTRALDFLQALSARKLALDCDDQQLWRAGVFPRLAADSKLNNDDQSHRLQAAIVRQDNLRWLTIMIDAGVDLCQVQMEGKYPFAPPLLNIAAANFGPEFIQLILDTGCDPQRGAPPKSEHNKVYQLNKREWYSPALQWTLRRHANTADPLTTPNANNQALLAKLDQRMKPSADELNGPDYYSYGSVFYNLTEVVLNSDPKLLVSLLKAGAKPNAGLPLGQTWFSPFYDNHIHGNNDEHAPAIALLNVLTQTQLKQVLNQAPLPIDDVGKRLTALAKSIDPKHYKTPLRDYVCQRQALSCP